MNGITLTEAHPLHGRSKCPICNGTGTVFSTGACPGSRRIITCGLCHGRKWVFARQFEPSCDKCQAEQYQHEYHTKQGLLTHDH